MDERNPRFAESAQPAEVSCRNIGWCFELCQSKRMDVSCILKNVPYPREHLLNPARFIDWVSFTTFFDNFLTYISEAELKEAGKDSWQSDNMRVYGIIGHLLYSLREQYAAAYGPVGFVAKLYPCELSIVDKYPGRITVTLKMKPGYEPCHAFQVALAGQMSGLPGSIGYPEAKVQVSHEPDGAIYNVYYQPYGGFFSPIIRFLLKPFIRRESATKLDVTYRALFEKYRELQSVNNQLQEAENKIRENESKYNLLASNVEDVLWTANLDLRIQYVSPSVKALTGYSETEALDLTLEEILDPTTVKKIETFILMLKQGDEITSTSHTFETEIICRDERPIWVEGKSNLVLDNDGKPRSIIGVIRDISKRRNVQKRLKVSEKNYRVIADTAQDAIFTFDDEGIITFANPSTVRIFKYSLDELIGLALKRIIPDAYSISARELDQLTGENVILTAFTKKKKSVSLEISFAKHEKYGRSFYTGIARDITQRQEHEKERDRLQTQLQASQKMESIGQLTGGIAHDFNNLLVAINGYAELGLNQNTSIESTNHYLREIRLAGERAADMTHKLLAFSRRQIIEPSIFDVCTLVNELGSMIQRLLPESIDIKFKQNSAALNVLADPGQVEQIIVNLSVNARDAMPHGGELTITCFNLEIDAEFVESHSYASQGSYAVIEVTDTGFGMSAETQEKIFEPFFTTKPEGAGTGLGLAVVFGIIKQHNGFINVRSEIGAGSTFSIFLPRSDGIVTVKKYEPASITRGGSETLLIVEDNKQVRDLACIILKSAGYQIHSARDGLDALKKFRQLSREIDLVVMDVVMPRMGGCEVLEKMQAIRSDIKVIFTSGYSNQGIHTNFILEQNLEFIQKPYHTELLRRKIRRVLDDQSTAKQEESSSTP